jgi:hypothetical protein
MTFLLFRLILKGKGGRLRGEEEGRGKHQPTCFPLSEPQVSFLHFTSFTGELAYLIASEDEDLLGLGVGGGALVMVLLLLGELLPHGTNDLGDLSDLDAGVGVNDLLALLVLHGQRGER